MDDEADTQIGEASSNDELSFTINANISFEQIIESETEQEINETP